VPCARLGCIGEQFLASDVRGASQDGLEGRTN
jgi:hypothetical protein